MQKFLDSKKPFYYSTFALCMLFVLLLNSCSGRKSKQYATSAVKRADFISEISVPGETQPVKTISVCTPVLHSNLSILYLIDEGSKVFQGDTICKFEARELEGDYSVAIKNLENAHAEYNKSKANLELQYLLLNSQALTIESMERLKKLDSVQLEFSSESDRAIIRLEMQRAEIERKLILKKLEFLKRINKSELRKMEMIVRKAQNKVDQIKGKLDKLTIVSPQEGMIIYCNNWSTGNKLMEGDKVWENMPVVEIPNLAIQQVKVLANESNYKRLKEQQKVTITFDAIPGLSLMGKIKRKSPMGKPLKRRSEVKIYDVIVSLDSQSVLLQPGMSAICRVQLEKIADTVVAPLVSIFDEDTCKIVYILEKDKFRRAIVNVAYTSSTQAVVSSGLTVGDLLSLTRPAEYLISDKSGITIDTISVAAKKNEKKGDDKIKKVN